MALIILLVFPYRETGTITLLLHTRSGPVTLLHPYWPLLFPYRETRTITLLLHTRSGPVTLWHLYWPLLFPYHETRYMLHWCRMGISSSFALLLSR